MDIGRAFLTALAVVALLPLSGSQAFAGHLHCGDAITQDTTLDTDLTCQGDGLIIGAESVTLDLNGHKIQGPGATVFPFSGIRAEGDSSHQFTGLEIRNGTVTGFAVGIGMEYAGAAVRDMTLSGDNEGLFGTKLTTLTVEDGVFSNNYGDGLAVIKGTSDGAIYRNNVAANNGGEGMTFSFADGGFSLTGNVIMANAKSGLDLFKAFGPGEVSHNRVTANGSSGINQSYCGGPIAHNVISGNHGDGISRFVSASACPVSDNLISDNFGNGIRQYDTDLTAENNLIWGNGENGVLVNNDAPFVPPTAHLTGNTASHNKLDGIHIGPDTGGFDHTADSVLDRNTTDRNGDDGIETESPNTALSGNHAWFNEDLGIEAVPGVTGSGNWAKHNGNLAQCVPVSLCSTTGKPK